MSVFKEYGYQVHNKARQEHLTSLGLPLAGRWVLELGAGEGDHTQFLLDQGCKVIPSDGRQANVDVMKERFPNLDVRLIDVEKPFTCSPHCAVIHCYGLLYHCADPYKTIYHISRLRPSLFLLETCVSPLATYPKPEESKDPRCSIRGTGSRPSRHALHRFLGFFFPHVYMPTTQPNHDEFPIDWDSPIIGEARAVYVASTEEIVNPLLTTECPKHQTRLC